MIHYSKENRDAAMKHLEEAREFLNRIEEKKEEEVRKWREKLKHTEERERLLEYYRQKKLYNKRKGKHRKRHSPGNKMDWDIDQMLLKEIMDEFTPEERKELEQFHAEDKMDSTEVEFYNVFKYCCVRSPPLPTCPPPPPPREYHVYLLYLLFTFSSIYNV